MAFNKLFSYASVDIPNKSGHDEFHKNFFSAPCGTLVPSFVDFLIPGDIVDLSSKMHVQLPPMATDFYGRINLRTELFYVPCRILFGGWKDFITYPSEGIQGPAPDDPNYHAKYLPGLELNGSVNMRQIWYFDSANTNSVEDWVSSATSGVRRFFEEAQAFISSIDNLPDADKFDKFINYVVSNKVDSFPVLAGSLADYLGFKVSNNSFFDEPRMDLYDNFVNLVFNYDTFILELEDDLRTAYNNRIYHVDKNQLGNGVVNKFDITLDSGRINTIVSFYVDGLRPVDLYINNVLPFVAYHKIYDDWYRDARIQKPLFPSALSSTGSTINNIAYVTKYTGGFDKRYYKDDQLNFYDGNSLLDLRQRLWQKDYFTTMTAQPQAGDPMKVSFDTTGETGEFTIASLRVANSLQQWLERNNMVDPRYGDVMYAQYGEYPSDAVTDRCIYLGSNTIEVYNKSVYQQGEYAGNTSNPFNAVGSKYASPVGIGDGNLVNNYKVTEHGFLMALTSLVPEAYYSSGTRRYLHYNTIDDIAFPLLQGVGDQEVYAREIIDTFNGEGDKTVIGYQQRYAEYKFIEDQVHGLLRDGQSLSAFALQRSFTRPPQLGTEFLEIPREYLDQVSASTYKVSDYGCWINSNWDYKKVSSLSESNSIPTLGRMRDVHSISVAKSGNRL